jgi:N-acetylglucosaminyldiphosphoundecaprenol N-acetyl-beta-D-mannosaminyltransferase
MFINILGYEIFNENKLEFLKLIFSREGKINIVSGNPEVLNNGLKDKELNNFFKSSRSIIIPDGIGTILSAKLKGKKIAGKIAGITVMDSIIEHCSNNNLGIYLLGGTEETVSLTYANLLTKYPKLNITGYRNGFFDLDSCQDILTDINRNKPYAVFAAMGSPRQERFIIKYMDIIDSRIFMGVGGSFDVIAGKTKRAPDWMIGLGFEWLYRVYKEPFRIKRLFQIPMFILKAIFYKSKEKIA